MDQVLSSRILDWDFDDLFSEVNDVGNTVNDSDFETLSTNKSGELSLVVELDSLSSKSVQVGCEQSSEGSNLASEGIVSFFEF